MRQSRRTINRLSPWLVSSASSVYVLRRARQLALAEPTNAALISFLLRQSDVIVLMVGSHITWYLLRQRIPQRYLSEIAAANEQIIHQLRQAHTALRIGLGLLSRRMGADQPEVVALITRLNHIISDAAGLLRQLDEQTEATAAVLPAGPSASVRRRDVDHHLNG